MHIVIVGVGTTGTEIAQALAISGSAITLHDANANALRPALAQVSRTIDRSAQTGLVDRHTARRAKRVFRLTTDLQACATADIVIEAIPDTLDGKRALLRDLDRLVRPDTVLASSTNLHPITVLAAATRVPDRVLGLHFFRPAHLAGVVEVVQTPTTRQGSIDAAADLIRSARKTPLILHDAPGLIVNRVAQAYFGEALTLLDETTLDAETIDRLMEAAGFARGPFRQMDFLGVDRVFAITRAIFDATYYAAPYRPDPRLERMVSAGMIGERSSLGGFYRDGKANAVIPKRRT